MVDVNRDADAACFVDEVGRFLDRLGTVVLRSAGFSADQAQGSLVGGGHGESPSGRGGGSVTLDQP